MINKILIALTLACWCLSTKAQEVTTNIVVIPDHLTFSGQIDKYPISMNLYLHGRDRREGTGRRIFGTYQYQKTGVPIDLVGEIYMTSHLVEGKVKVTEATLSLSELNEEGQKTATFSGILKGKEFNGRWKKISEQSFLEVKLKKTSLAPLKRGNNATFEVSIGDISYSLPFTDHYPCTPELDTSRWLVQGDTAFVLATFSYMTNCVCRNRGNCGCGLEKYLVYLVASTKEKRVLEYANYKIHSCEDAIDFYLAKDGRPIDIKDVRLDSLGELILEINYIRNSIDYQYTLKKNDMKEGFKLKANE